MNIPEPTMYMPSTTATGTASTMGYAPHPHHLQHHSLPLPPPGFDIHGNPIKIRKKPGRKPNPASPALRKMQNRAAQRAFRERKERHLKDLENTIKTLREQRNTTAKELKKVKNKLEIYKTENWYLKGVMLTLQFMCMHHNIDLPPHTPYLAEEVLMEMAKTHPHAIEAYVNAYTRNNLNLKPNLSPNYNTKSSSSNTNSSSTTSLVNKHEQHQQQQQIAKESIHSPSSTATNQFGSMSLQDHPSSESIASPPSSSTLIPPASNYHHHHHHHQEGKEEQENKKEQEEGLMMDHDMKQEYMEYKQEQHEDDMSPAPMTPKTQSSLTFEHDDVAKWTMDDAEDDDEDDEEDNKGHGHGGQEKDHEGKVKNKNTHPTTSLGAIQRIRLQLRVQSTLSTISGGDLQSDRLQPTLLQLAIPHDLRIDLIPAPMMRDRMIIFRDQMDYDRCFSMLLNGAVYHGGDPTLSQSWELPPSFHSEYWFLSSRYDLETTNRWRRLKNLPEIPPGDPHRRQWTPPPSTLSCQQLDQQQHENGDTIGSPASTSSTNHVSKHPLYEKVLGIPPELRHTVTSPTLDMMMEMMNALSPNKTNTIKDA
ncbi:hypothetical protein BJ944DRAFT_188615 [Cunninghamella echinulata]|nr:hypothetical protein BJ944DRAFT_188615 [Cunninghamella echinulata]